MSLKKRLLSCLATTTYAPWLTEVEWLENPFSQANSISPYIDTGIFPSWDIPFEMSATITKTSENRILPLSNYANALTFYIEVTATNRLRFGSQDSTASDPTFVAFDAYTSSSYPIPLNKPTRIWVKYNPRNDEAHTVDYEIGLEALDGSGTTTSTTGTCYRAGSPSSNTRTLCMFYDYRSMLSTFDGGFKLHQLEVKCGTTHQKYIPCLDIDDIPCMYEQISGKLYYNNGTSTFNSGRHITEVEWINLTGSQRFNTGFLPNELSTTLKATFEITPNSLETFPFGVRKLQGYEESCAMYIGPVVTGSPYGYLRLDWPMRAGSSVARYNFTASTEKITLEATGNYSNVNGQVLTTNTVVDFTHPKPFYIGNCYTESSNAFQSAFVGKFYVVNLLNTYTRDDYRYCVPAHDENNVGFFFDRTNHFIMDNEGQNTQDMTWGDEIHSIGYIYGGYPSSFKTLGITFSAHKWETDMKAAGNNDSQILLGSATGAANYWGVSSIANAYMLHTTSSTYWIYMDAKERRTVFLDSNDLGNSKGILTMEVEGQTISRTASSGFNTSTAYNLFYFNSNYIGKMWVYGNRCYDRTTNQLLLNWVPVETGDKVCKFLDTITHTLFSAVSSPEELTPGYNMIGYQMGNELPYGFVELNYLESTGTQYLNTDITPTNAMGIDVTYAYPTISGSANSGLCGTYQGTAPRTDAFFVSTLSGKTDTNIILANAGQARNMGVTPTANTWYNAKINWLDDGYLNLDGTTYAVGTNTIESNKLLIFARTLASDSSIACSVARIRRYRITDGKRISHDYVPCLRTYDNKPGMFDMVSRQFLTNQGTGEFIYEE